MQVMNDIKHPTVSMVRLLDYIENLLGHHISKQQINEYVKNVVMVAFDSIDASFTYEDIPDKTTIYLESTPDLLRLLSEIYPPEQMTEVCYNIANLVASIVDEVSMKYMEELMTTQVTVVDFNRTTLYISRVVKTWVM